MPDATAPLILVVDDDDAIRRFLRISLSASGYGVTEARNGALGLAKAATETPALVVLDLGLPDMDGREVVARLRDWSQAPVLVLSVRSDEAEKVAALDAGANDYMVKSSRATDHDRIHGFRRGRPCSEDLPCWSQRGGRVVAGFHRCSFASGCQPLPAPASSTGRNRELSTCSCATSAGP